MRFKLLLLVTIFTAFSMTSLAQVTVTSQRVKYERKGADVSEWKKTFEVNYPKFSGIEDKDTLRKLEETFSYWRVFNTSLQEETDYQWLGGLDFKVTYNKNGIIELAFNRWGSGAYPSEETRTIVADISSGTRIEMTDVFKNRIGLLTEIDKMQQLEIAAAKGENKEENDTDGGEFDNVEKASDQVREFSVGDLGVTFLYDYGFPHVIKALEPAGKFFFSWAELKPFMKEYGGLYEAAKNAPTPENTVVIVDLRLGGVLGGVAAGNFIDGETAAKMFAPNAKSVALNPATKTAGLRVNMMNAAWKVKLAEQQSPDVCPEFRYIDIAPELKNGIAIGAGANWNAIPKPITEFDKRNRIYESAVVEFLKTKGIVKPVAKIEQLYKVDLDGDGTDEVVIRATNYTHSENEFTPDKDGYSFVMVRKVVDGKAKDILLTGDFITDEETSAENTHEISAIADLNGDGKMEIVVYGQYYEGAWASAYQIVGGDARAVLEVGCGL